MPNQDSEFQRINEALTAFASAATTSISQFHTPRSYTTTTHWSSQRKKESYINFAVGSQLQKEDIDKNLASLFVPKPLIENNIPNISLDKIKINLESVLSTDISKEKRNIIKKLLEEDDLIETLANIFGRAVINSIYSQSVDMQLARKARHDLMKEIISGNCNEE